MKTSTFEIEISARISEVWKALTTKEGMEAWAKSVTVDTEWKVGNDIVFTCYDEKGRVAVLEGKKMIFNGVIEVAKENSELSYVYPNKLFGIEKESYVLQKVDEKSTLVKMEQVYSTEEAAKGSEDGQKQILEMLKKYLEAK
jgi:uncharacterized protein YndB with AHSA1/START domain